MLFRVDKLVLQGRYQNRNIFASWWAYSNIDLIMRFRVISILLCNAIICKTAVEGDRANICGFCLREMGCSRQFIKRILKILVGDIRLYLCLFGRIEE